MLFLPSRTFRVTIKLLNPALGTVPHNRSLWTTYKAQGVIDDAAKMRKDIANAGLNPEQAMLAGGLEPATEANARKKAEEEAEMIVDSAMTGYTGFLKDAHGKEIQSAHVIKAVLKNAASVYKTFGPLKQLKNKVQKYVFIREKFVPIVLGPNPDNWAGEDGHPMVQDGPTGPVCERPLRASTPQGERVALTCSDVVPAGSTIQFHLVLVNGSGLTDMHLVRLFAYGQLEGIGQWRSSNVFGQFEISEFVELDKRDAVITDVLAKAMKAGLDEPEEVEESAASEVEAEQEVAPAATPKKRGRPAKAKVTVASEPVTRRASAADLEDDE